MEIITGKTGSSHITPEDDASIHEAIFGINNVVLDVNEKLAYEIINSNTIRIKSGDVLIQGKQGRIRYDEYTDVSIDSGSTGYNRNDIIAVNYTLNNGIESMSLTTIKGTPSTGNALDPDTIDAQIKDGATQTQMALYRIKLEGVNILAVECMFTLHNFIENNLISTSTTKSLSALQGNVLKGYIDELNNRDPVKLFEGAAQTGTITLNQSMDNFRFLVFFIKNSDTSSGPFGYGLVPVGQFGTVASERPVVCFDNVATEKPNSHTTYLGRVKFTSATNINIENVITNVVHTSGTNHGGATFYWIREIWGLK